MNSVAEVGRLVERACLNRDGQGVVRRIMPEPAAAGWAKIAGQCLSAIGWPGPGFRHALGQAKTCSWHQKRQAEGGNREFLAFSAMAGIECTGLASTLIADVAALAASGQHLHHLLAHHLLAITYCLKEELKPRLLRCRSCNPL